MTEDKAYCNLCECETKQDDDGCVWHQRVSYTDDGELVMKYEEFNQDGEEW